VGVGAVDAAVGASLAIAQVAPAQVIFVGTAGRYPSAATARALPIRSVALPDEVLLLSTAALRGDGYFPAPLVQRSAADLSLVEALRAASPRFAWRGAAATALAITRSAALARRISKASGADVENLEAFAVARAAARAGVPMAAVLGIANTVGPAAHTEWRRHHLAASRAACEVVWAWLRARVR
jgi:purine-nucleoside phosphorylase